MVFLISKNHNWNFPLHAWFDIESEKEAINRVSKENWRRHLDGELVFGGEPPKAVQRYIITIVVPIIFIFVMFSI